MVTCACIRWCLTVVVPSPSGVQEELCIRCSSPLLKHQQFQTRHRENHRRNKDWMRCGSFTSSPSHMAPARGSAEPAGCLGAPETSFVVHPMRGTSGCMRLFCVHAGHSNTPESCAAFSMSHSLRAFDIGHSHSASSIRPKATGGTPHFVDRIWTAAEVPFTSSTGKKTFSSKSSEYVLSQT